MMETGDSGLGLAASNSNQQRNILSANPFDDSDESSNDSDVTWSPGDGVCPTAAHFNHCCQSKIDDWQNAASTRLEGTESLHYYITAFLNLLKDVPSFYACPPGAVQLSGRAKSFLVLKSSLQVGTTEDSNCEQDHKFMDYLQCFGSPAPVFYRTEAETQAEVSIPTCARPLRSGFLTSIVLAWSYIISCRWVEILQRAGEKSQILHDQGMQIEESFRDIVTQDSWKARVENQKGAFYSPWMFRREGTSRKRRDWKLAIPNSFFAFSTLLDFCASNGLEGEFLIGFACVLISTSRHAPPPKLAPPTMIPAVPMHSPLSAKDMMLFELFKSVDKCISLSSTQDALDSLLCSAFFDPCVPCNLFGAASLGVSKALSTMEKIDNRQLLSAITNKKPQLSLLWAAAVCNGQATSFLNLSLHSLPPICLVAAFWTNTIQSFLQIAYSVRDSEESIIARANEFRTSYFCRPDLFVPWSPAPPFGTTPVHNLSLEVRAHLEHMHVPLSWRNYWLLDSGERIPAGSQHDLEVVKADGLCHPCPAGQSNDTPHPERYTADEQSGFATSRLFNWHRGYDDGIWLDDGKANIESVRRLQMHPWIIDQFDDRGDEPVEEPRHRGVSVERILRWNQEVQEYRRAGNGIP
ncbi:uncharacterized protein BO66DRAFT_26040 [Aspergillus aculeatinus CBS 121060]|uniref:Uncharacterized protein n=1 Tax=Aspergillus aculeatinus CBS 121060 TaxID=1448322 RepID=A0ACD1HG66_9EURO|nr:hypothetical protein BO66DRAFT_26040 [Aspergillus aculeatinus CBS 121060]RAH72565.1 hypothetical protein BO66DRAFT_26040 [Aspergillus aculeatinus CBS 121060]